MANEEYSADDLQRLTAIEHLRQRPSMYLGSTGLQGISQFFFSSVTMLLNSGATWIDITHNGSGYDLKSDADVTLTTDESGTILELETLHLGGPNFEGAVICGLSRRIEIVRTNQSSRCSVVFEQGEKKKYLVETLTSHEEISTTISFEPDLTIFTVGQISPFLIDSYLRRVSYRKPGVRIRFAQDGKSHEYFSENGIRDQFKASFVNHQILHQPIHLQGKTNDLEFELVFAFIGSNQDLVWCHAESFLSIKGCHLEGLANALDTIRSEYKLRKNKEFGFNGIVALMHINGPAIQFTDWRRGEVISANLDKKIEKLVVEKAIEWRNKHPDVAKTFEHFEPVAIY